VRRTASTCAGGDLRRSPGAAPTSTRPCREFGRDPRALARSVTALFIAERDEGRAATTRERFAGIPGEGHVAGTPEQCVARIRRYVEAGVRHLLFSIPDVASSAGLELAGRHVLPALRQEFAAT
jgi:alkanesulfonate monooxygenase SsuD/methylene tetrahydromethanopterin reductase-like flavin-dependent oxidoreductase (luciferase family)